MIICKPDGECLHDAGDKNGESEDEVGRGVRLRRFELVVGDFAIPNGPYRRDETKKVLNVNRDPNTYSRDVGIRWNETVGRHSEDDKLVWSVEVWG